MALVALSVTAVLQAVSVALDSLSGPTMVATTTGLVGALTAFVFAERTRSTHQLRDCLIAIALGMLSAADLILLAGPTLVNSYPGNSWRWVTLAAQLAAYGILVGAAFSPNLDLSESSHGPRTIVAAAASALAAIAGAMFVWHSHLPSLLGSTASPGSSAYSGPPAHPLLSYLQISCALLAACAAVGLARHSAHQGDGMERSIAAGVTVLAVASFSYFVVPP